MENKTYIREIRRNIAEKTHLSEGQAGEFLSSLFSTIAKGLERDQIVKITGLGTFKTQWVEPRKSVNIATGEPVLLEGYHKVVFTPEVSLRERVNAPFAAEESITIDSDGNVEHPTLDPIARFGEQANEINELLSEINDLEPESAENDAPVAVDEPVVNEEVIVENSTEESAEETTAQVSAPVAVGNEEDNEESVETSEPTKKERKPFRPWLVAIITIGIFALILVGAYFFLRHQITNWAEGLLNKNEQEEYVIIKRQNTDVSYATPSEAVEEPAEVAVEEYAAKDVAPQEQKEVSLNDTLALETLKDGSRLTYLARKYYHGNYHMWVYIYLANKSVLPNPDVIPVGKTIVIPRLSDTIIDMNNSTEIAKADSIAKEILK